MDFSFVLYKNNPMKYLTLLAVVFLLWNCTEEAAVEKADITLTFKGVFDDQPLTMLSDVYSYEDDMKLKFQLIQYYLSDLVLDQSNAIESAHQLVDIASINFGEMYSENLALEGLQVTIPDIPVGNYDRLRYGLGVAPDFNATGPADYEIGHPLSDNYWSWAMGYVFFKIEGNADLEGQGDFSEKLTFHIGTNEMYRSVTATGNFEHSLDRPLALTFELDVYRLLVDGEGEYLNFRETPIDHTNNRVLGNKLADNLVEAIQIYR